MANLFFLRTTRLILPGDIENAKLMNSSGLICNNLKGEFKNDKLKTKLQK